MPHDPAERALRAFEVLLRSSHVARPDDIPARVREAAALLGADDAVVYVVDYDQVMLVPLLAGVGVGDPALAPRPTLPLAGTLAGRAFTEVDVQVTGSAANPADGATAWAPVLDGSHRLGVLELTFPDRHAVDSALRHLTAGLASVVADLVMSRSHVGDLVERTRRRLPLSLEAELQWSLLPPLSFVAPQVSISGVLVPANEVAGDSFDYAVNDHVAHLAIIDAMGHGLDATLMSAVAVGALRNGRRSGLDLQDTVRSMDKHLSAQFGDFGFVTAIVGELDTHSGIWRWVTAGHPPGLVVRDGHVVKVLDSPVDPPLGVLVGAPTVGEERLQRGDRLLLHTDGVIEARDSAGVFFGIERLVDYVSREAAAGRPAAETLRRLVLGILAHQEGFLQDDATTILVDWAGDDPSAMTP